MGGEVYGFVEREDGGGCVKRETDGSEWVAKEVYIYKGVIEYKV